MKKSKQKRAERTIRTDYYFRGQIVKQTRAAHPNKASRNAFDHLQTNDYGATSAQVIDEAKGEQVHCEFVRKISGEVRCSFKRDPRDFVTPGTLEHFKRLRKEW